MRKPKPDARSASVGVPTSRTNVRATRYASRQAVIASTARRETPRAPSAQAATQITQTRTPDSTVSSDPTKSPMARRSQYQRDCSRRASAAAATQHTRRRQEAIDRKRLSDHRDEGVRPDQQGERERRERRVERGSRPHETQIQDDEQEYLCDVDAAEPEKVISAREFVHDLQLGPEQRPEVRAL